MAARTLGTTHRPRLVAEIFRSAREQRERDQT
jgi:hypothetical protein